MNELSTMSQRKRAKNKMRLFTVGPVEMYPETLEIASKQLPYFRTDEFSDIMKENKAMLLQCVNADEGAHAIFLTCSGSGAMEATVLNCCLKSDRVLVINGGGFGKRFCEICEIHNLDYSSVDVPFGEKLDASHLEKYNLCEYDVMLVNMHETSTGQLYDIDMLRDICEKNNIFLVVDAISSFGADDVDMKNQKVDALIMSSQKALALAPGLSMVVISKKMWQERVLINEKKSLYFDFISCDENLLRGQTPFTPAVRILIELNQRLKQYIFNLADEKYKRANLVKWFRTELVRKSFIIPSYPLSQSLTPVLLEQDAYQFYTRLRNEFELTVTPCGGELKNKMIRIGHLGNLEKMDYERLLNAMEEIRGCI